MVHVVCATKAGCGGGGGGGVGGGGVGVGGGVCAEAGIAAPEDKLHATGHGCLCHTVRSASQTVGLALTSWQLGGYAGVSDVQGNVLAT